MKRRIFPWMGLVVLFFAVGSFFLCSQASAKESYHYKVRRGDTLAKIAKKFDMTVDDLKEINGMKRNALKLHQRLLIPVQGQDDASPSRSSETEIHIVKKGDNVYQLAKKAGISPTELRSLNHLRGNRLSIGQRLVLTRPPTKENWISVTEPQSSTSTAAVTLPVVEEKNDPAPSAPVRTKEDAKRNATVAAAPVTIALTPLSGATIEKTAAERPALLNSAASPGQVPPADKPAKPPVAFKSVVDQQDEQALAMRGVKDGKPGEEVMQASEQTVPAREKAATTAASAPAKGKQTITKTTYEVKYHYYTAKKGDNLPKIAKKTGLSVASLKKMNHQRSNYVRAGKTLIVGRYTTTVEKEIPVSDKVVANIQQTVLEDDDEEAVAEDGTLSLPDDVLAIEKDIETSSDPLGKWNDSAERNLFIRVATGFLGAPYRLGGTSVRGIDCSAFVRKIYDLFGINLPRTAREQARVGMRVSRANLEEGDLVFFNTRHYLGHVGIYIGDNKFVHASSGRSHGVRISSLNEPYYDKRFVKAVRLKALDGGL
ncbi:MAG: LysM peptidoglycan-binding domain-containing protein [Smithellaceae bacterium]|nr:LysM peptidoglycan-binding domain-containing protein [Smithellaceae bacterium]